MILSAIIEYVIPFLVVFSVLVFVHEMGHYLAARCCGVRIEVFSIGIGPELLGWTDRVRTRWKLCAVPIGGYVRMLGEMQPGYGTPSAEPDAFETKSLGERAFIVAAGPVANFLLAIAILAGMFASVGQPFTPSDIGSVLPDSAAERAGFRSGDTITRIDSTRIERFEQVVYIVQLNPGKPLEFRVIRDGEEISLTAVPDILDIEDRLGNPQRIGRLGVSRSAAGKKYVRYDPATAVWRAFRETWGLTLNIFQAIGQILDGTRTTRELGGPIRIAQLSGDMWQTGIASVLTFTAILSINLGLVNLIPIPVLDGGHLLFYAVEALMGRPLSARARDYGLRIGLGMVLALMIFATWNDLMHLGVVEYLIGLAT